MLPASVSAALGHHGGDWGRGLDVETPLQGEGSLKGKRDGRRAGSNRAVISFLPSLG